MCFFNSTIYRLQYTVWMDCFVQWFCVLLLRMGIRGICVPIRISQWKENISMYMYMYRIYIVFSFLCLEHANSHFVM